MTSHILSEFCTRLAAGLSAMMVCTPWRLVGLQFFRTLMLVVLGLSVLGLLSGAGLATGWGLLLLSASVLAFVGFVFATLGRPVAGDWTARLLLLLTAIALTIPAESDPIATGPFRFLEIGQSWSSALLLGSVVGAMLLGHSYLIAPTMSIQPLMRLVLCIWGSLGARATLAALSLMMRADEPGVVTAGHGVGDFWWWMFGARWLVGLAVPAILGWMVWQSARIRATQSATGILYAAVVLVFFGELVGEMLQ